MPDDDQDDDPIDTVGSDPKGQTQEPADGAAKVETPKPAPEELKGQQEGVQQVKHSDFKRIKEEQRAKGRRETIEELNANARALGFESHDDAMKALAALKKPAAPPAKTPPTPKEPPAMPPTPKKNDSMKTQQEILAAAKSDEERRKLRKDWRRADQERRELQAQLDAKDAEMALREECWKAGIKDVDYAIRLLTRALDGKSEEEIGTFDRSKFYEELKTEKPYLFGEVVAPANTGTDGSAQKKDDAKGTVVGAAGSAPIPPAAGSEAAKAADPQFDARKAKPEDIQNRLRALGLNPHL